MHDMGTHGNVISKYSSENSYNKNYNLHRNSYFIIIFQSKSQLGRQILLSHYTTRSVILIFFHDSNT